MKIDYEVKQAECVVRLVMSLTESELRSLNVSINVAAKIPVIGHVDLVGENMLTHLHDSIGKILNDIDERRRG